MGVSSFNEELTSSVPPEKLFKAVFLDSDTLLPKILPQVVNNVQVLKGNGDAGTHKVFSFLEGNQVKYMKYHVDELDKQNLVYKYTIIEGDVLTGPLESMSCNIKIEPSGDGGSVWKATETYNTKGDAQIKEEHLKGMKEQAKTVFKAIEAYVQSNPNYQKICVLISLKKSCVP